MTAAKPALRHYLQFKDLTRDEYAYLFDRTRWIKSQFKAYQRYWPLSDRTLVMIFEKASTRTRVSFEVGMAELGGDGEAARSCSGANTRPGTRLYDGAPKAAEKRQQTANPAAPCLQKI